MTSRNRSIPGRSRARGRDDRQYFRHARTEHLVLEELRSILRDDARHPGLSGIALLRLDLSPDGSFARVAYAVSPGAGESHGDADHRTRGALEAATGFLRARLAVSLDTGRLPQLGFTFVGVAAGAQEGGEEPCLE